MFEAQEEVGVGGATLGHGGEVGEKRKKQGAECVEEEVGVDRHGREEETRADRHLWGTTGELQKNGWKGGNEPS